MRFPEFLRPGGTIGFTAPSFGCAIEPYRTAFDHAQAVFRRKGHPLLLGDTAYAGDGIGISSTPQKCGEEFTQMVCSPGSDVLISCGGGELMCEILDYVDFDAIRSAPPKWFMGYSDNTNLTFLLATLCDTASIYGPCAASFGMKPWHPAIRDAYLLLRGEKLFSEGYPLYETDPDKSPDNPLAPYHCTVPRKIVFRGDRGQGTGDRGQGSGDRVQETGDRETAGEIQFSGRLIGGCLDILSNLCGTKYDKTASFLEKYKDDGFIWFLEACDLNVFDIRRAVWKLQHAGWFEHVSGFLIGRPWAGQQDLMGLDHIRAVTDILDSLRVPILLDVDIGHLPPMMPLITGSLATVTCNPSAQTFRLTQII